MSKSGNPYANVDRDMAADDANCAATRGPKSAKARKSLANSVQADLFDGSAISLPRESMGSGNPYANVPSVDEDEYKRAAICVGDADSQRRNTVSKQEFRESLTLLFSRYSPALLRDRLRPHYREFIVRNESRSPTQRFEIISALRKYDLSGMRGLTTYLNRDDDLFAEEVLKSIEDSVDGAE